jgi:hypothetical protein
MESIISNHYLAIHLASFMDIPNTINLIQTSHMYHNIIASMVRYQEFQKCKPNCTIDSICKYGDVDILKWFMINHQINFDKILWMSAKHGNLDIVSYLIEHGADIHARRDHALRWCAKNGHLDVVKYLVNHGADIHSHHNGALFESAANGHLEIVHYLVDKGADINAHHDYEYALGGSAINGHLEVVRYLSCIARSYHSFR